MGCCACTLYCPLLYCQGGEDVSAIAQAICDEAEAVGAAAIVIASHCHPGSGIAEGLAELIRGSRADYAVRHTAR